VLRLRSGSDRSRADIVLDLSDTSQIGETRRVVTALARRLGFDDTRCGQAAIVVSEAASNVLKHAGQGELLASEIEQDDDIGLEFLILDKGPGMADPARCLRDGFSTAGTAGIGLGALSRVSDFFEMHSLPAVGTAVLIRVWSRRGGPKVGSTTADGVATGIMDAAAVHLAKPGQDVCGDGWAVEQEPGRSRLLVTDGLGHGPLAAEVSRAAVRVFREHVELPSSQLLERMHLALRPTRGAAVGLADVNLATRTLRFTGVGNIAGTIYSDGASQSTVSHGGTVGHEVRKIQEFEYPFPKSAVLVVHSDGLATHWRLDRYAGLASRDPRLIAGILYRDFKRGRDDVTVLAAREIDGSGV
jgi:anti-sigma regulatory factor (Ser/Thr protein kinase)